MVDITPLLAFRWSPRAFDPDAELTGDEAASLLEAARWAPSAGNTQPWRFALGHRHDETWKRILVSLPADDQRWARDAAALVLGAHIAAHPQRPAVSHGHPERAAQLQGGPERAAHPQGDPERAAYDLGQAMAHLVVQATALGLHAHQLTDFDRVALRADLDLPAEVRPLSVTAVGRLGDPFRLPEELRRRETGLRRRHPAHALLLR
ncbi:nitroreductase family protein [Micromonospora sp. KC721]|uniref:nitroreductase family protein n=1 Tax=Micromonospora sp. KC721 TaxID=2530380 RepID=UPI001049EC7C|nr:nitroreductase family protein [Micromonospora sp. KC721]TDB79487.1 nitroreductase [Micromonospora sp. KC721]